MRGNSLRFLKPSVFIKTFLVFCAIFAAMLSISCKQLASFEPSVDGARVVVSKTFSAPTDLTATQGRKQKISLEWTPVSGAKYYEIHSAKSATAEFEKIYETDKNSFDDKVGAGSTRYYKVCAVKSNGTKSAFSTIVKGTSLAQPVISGGTITESTATIFWFMENARGINEDNYEEFLKFEVFCEGGSDTLSQTFDAKEMSSYKCDFYNLAGSTEYTFYVVAYTTKDLQSTEQTPRVNKNTLTSYTPLAPTFNASEGTSAEGIWLNITLPEMVKVNTVTKISPDEKVDESYPLYFKVFRRIVDTGSYDEVCDLYYNGTEFTTDPVKYQEGGAPYKAGETGAWFDNDVNLRGGEKYEYKIISYSDTAGYDTVVCPEGTKNNSTSTPDDDDKLFKKAVGWKCARPSFDVKFDEDGGRTLSADKAKVVSVSFGFSAAWNDLGKAGDYKFAIKQNRKPLDASDSSAGDDTWLENKKKGSEFFDTLEEINSFEVKFGSENDGLDDDEKGVYSYTLYIVSKSETEVDESKVLVNVAALDTIQVTEDVNLPEALLDVEGGYKDKVVLEISKFDNEVKYKITRIMLEGSPQEGESKEQEFDLAVFGKRPDGKYEDNSVQGNCRYSYILTATNPSGAWKKSRSIEAETLGTPDVSFNREALSYDSITISFDGVLAAKEYVVTLGSSGDFGGGATFEITKGDKEWNYESVPGSSSGEATAKVEFAANKFTVTINKPEGYDDAKLAGKEANVTVTAKSDKCPNPDASAPSKDEKVKVLGPASLVATVNTFENANEDYITVSWNKVDDAKGYLIRRVMYSDAEMKNVAAESEVTYYCDVSGKVTLVDDEMNLSGRIDPPYPIKDGIFTLKDIYKDTNSTTSGYEKAQAKIFWGLPFRYVVLPVLEKTDFDFESNSLKPTRNKIAAYTNFEEKQTDGVATLGYGMEVHAEKSKNTTKQTITWVKPYYASKTAPRVFRKLVYGNGTESNFSLVGGSANLPLGVNAFEYTLEDDDKYNAYEYIVQYGVVNTPTVKEGLRKDFEERKDAESPTEQANKGYLFTVEDFNLATCNLAATQGGNNTYAERVTWNTKMQAWDYKGRALGPTGIKLYVRNNNLDDQWHEVATINSIDYSGKITSNSEEDVSAAKSKGGDGISLYPTSCASGSGATNGALKVLRDYKHYYALSLTRGDLETQKYTPGFDDYSDKTAVYAYRQITDEEMVKGALLTLAYTLYLNADGKEDLSNVNSQLKTNGGKDSSSPNNGTAKFEKSEGILSGSEIGKRKIQFTLDKYAPEQLLPVGGKTSLFALSMKDISIRVKGAADPYLDKFRTENFTVTVGCVVKELENLNYTATLTMTCTGSDNLCIKKGEVTIINATDTETRRKWFPAQINDNHCWIKDSTYGWWPPSN